jgi:methylated-DNA-[protein]-cysteine S-methyltransferase
VIEALESVPFGETISYGELPAEMGRPGAARAVGTAADTNPMPIVALATG